MTKLEIIDETVAFYSENVDRRAMDDIRCAYFDTNTSNKCAVGRCLIDPEKVERMLRKDLPTDVFNLYKSGIIVEESFQDKYKGHSIVFWNELQKLHDIDDYWQKGGLTKIGKEYVNELKEMYKNEKV